MFCGVSCDPWSGRDFDRLLHDNIVSAPNISCIFSAFLMTVRNSLFLRRKIDAVFGFRLRTQNFDLIWRHDLDLWLPVAKLDCTGDADDFPLDHSESLIGRYSGHGRNEASERLIGVFSSEIDKCGTQ